MNSEFIAWNKSVEAVNQRATTQRERIAATPSVDLFLVSAAARVWFDAPGCGC
jgi:hypothetical protein